jgi:hypothetical protein
MGFINVGHTPVTELATGKQPVPQTGQLLWRISAVHQINPLCTAAQDQITRSHSVIFVCHSSAYFPVLYFLGEVRYFIFVCEGKKEKHVIQSCTSLAWKKNKKLYLTSLMCGERSKSLSF